MKYLLAILCATLIGCLPATVMEFSQTDPKTGGVTTLRVRSTKEISAEDLTVWLDVQKGQASVYAKNIHSKSASVIKADTAHLEAVGDVVSKGGEAAGNLGGKAVSVILGTEGINAAGQGLGEVGKLIGRKIKADAAVKAVHP